MDVSGEKLKIGGTTRVFGVIGHPVAHSLSPLMQNRAIARMGLDAVYVPFDVMPEKLLEAVRGISAFGIGGVNVTVPHKTRVLEYLDSLTEAAGFIGAVNTIINDGGVLTGDNTDVYGFTKSIEAFTGNGFFPQKVAVIGAGGAARGVVYACAIRNEVPEITVLNRTLEKAEKLAHDISGATGKKILACSLTGNNTVDIIRSAGLVVNTTSVGMHPEEDCSPLNGSDYFHEGQIVCDIIYNPPKTIFLKSAESKGALILNGLPMLAWQGARSLSLWTGKDAPVDVMLEALYEHFGNG